MLAAEIAAAGGIVGQPGTQARGDLPEQGSGWVAWRVRAAQRMPDAGRLVFERQRMPGAVSLALPPGAGLPDDLPERLLEQAAAMPGAGARTSVALHVFTTDETGTASRARAAAWLEGRLRGQWAGRPELPALEPAAETPPLAPVAGRVWQLCLTEDGLWSSWAPSAALADDRPGGVHRMVRDDAAPSRSYLKVEEALSSGQPVFGGAPRARERVIDLGAAPGGWSYAFLKRGCQVLAVDNGPLKLSGLDRLPGHLTHLRADGLRLQPPPGWVPADWMLSDMLVAPGVCLGLLRKWVESGWMRRCIVNVKLPQSDPLVALRPLQAYLAQVPGLVWRMRQLYHDRREVTVMARLPDGTVPAQRPRRRESGASPGRGPRTARPTPETRAPRPGPRKSPKAGRPRRSSGGPPTPRPAPPKRRR